MWYRGFKEVKAARKRVRQRIELTSEVMKTNAERALKEQARAWCGRIAVGELPQ